MLLARNFSRSSRECCVRSRNSRTCLTNRHATDNFYIFHTFVFIDFFFNICVFFERERHASNGRLLLSDRQDSSALWNPCQSPDSRRSFSVVAASPVRVDAWSRNFQFWVAVCPCRRFHDPARRTYCVWSRRARTSDSSPLSNGDRIDPPEFVWRTQLCQKKRKKNKSSDLIPLISNWFLLLKTARTQCSSKKKRFPLKRNKFRGEHARYRC